MRPNFFNNPISRKRFLYFKEMKRAYISLWFLLILYLISLCAELICNNTPLYVRFENRSFFPIFKFYPEDMFVGNGIHTRPDYHRINTTPSFRDDPDNFMVFPPFPYGPFESIQPESIEIADQVTLKLIRVPMIGTVNIREDYTIARHARFAYFIGKKETEIKNLILSEFIDLPGEIKQAVKSRFANQEAVPVSSKGVHLANGEVVISLSTFSPRKTPPKTVRLMFRELETEGQGALEIIFPREIDSITKESRLSDGIMGILSQQERNRIAENIKRRFWGPVDDLPLTIGNINYTASFIKEEVRFPFAPVKGHLMGIDGAGRDVLARILYGLRTSMTFGILLVLGSMILGITAGALQGYYGGLLDITGQRLIEIWSALPFLYVMILLGSIYGRSFSLLLFCYGIFNWIGISYYIRAEFLRLRKQPFVEAAKCMGIPSYKVIFKHILPNGLIPVITFFPFSLVGAIGSLAALDYLGFGLPPPTPSWGELLFQAQQYRWAWWLILYPSLALFLVMLLGVFVGEGIRNAYDPKRYSRLEG